MHKLITILFVLLCTLCKPVYAQLDSTPVPSVPVPAPQKAGSGGGSCRGAADGAQNRMQIVYPPEARKRGIEGEVLVEFIYQMDGTVRDAVIRSSTNEIFNQAALDAVARFGMCGDTNKKPDKATRMQVPFRFKLDPRR